MVLFTTLQLDFLNKFSYKKINLKGLQKPLLIYLPLATFTIASVNTLEKLIFNLLPRSLDHLGIDKVFLTSSWLEK